MLTEDCVIWLQCFSKTSLCHINNPPLVVVVLHSGWSTDWGGVNCMLPISEVKGELVAPCLWEGNVFSPIQRITVIHFFSFYWNIELVLVFLLYLKPDRITPFNQNTCSWLWPRVWLYAEKWVSLELVAWVTPDLVAWVTPLGMC